MLLINDFWIFIKSYWIFMYSRVVLLVVKVCICILNVFSNDRNMMLEGVYVYYCCFLFNVMMCNKIINRLIL